jgi:hypothetical protein
MRLPSTRFAPLTALALSAFALAACASMNVGSYVERGADLRQYRTYTWGPADTRSTGDPRLDNNPFFDARVRADVDKELASRGFQQATSGMSDLLVHYHASVTQEIDLRNVDREYAYCDDADCRPYVYDAGTIFIDLVDARTKKLVWRGWAESSVDGVIDNQEWMEERIDNAVGKILQRLPRGQ